MRWGIETSFREFKYNLGVIHFHAITDDFVLQEIFAKLTMYNYCTAIVMHIKIPATPGRQLTYKINLSVGIYICMRFFKGMETGPPWQVEQTIREHLEPVRPGRADQREVKPKQAVAFIYRVA